MVLKYPCAAAGTDVAVGITVGGCKVEVGCTGVEDGCNVAVDCTGVEDGCNVAVGCDGVVVGTCNVAVDCTGVEVGVNSGIGVDVDTGIVGVNVTWGYASPLRTTLGATQSARSPVGKPLESARSTNLTVCPASGLKSTSA